MPSRAQKPCAYPGCIELVRYPVRRCEKHQIDYDHQISMVKDHKLSDKKREIHRLYDRNWQARRRRYLVEYPWCEDCLAVGIYKAASDVHHIIRHGGNKQIFITSPLRSLCHVCHTRRTLGEISGEDGIREDYYPFLKKPLPIPVFMVCGPPASGKSFYVDRHKNIGDLVIDLDRVIYRITKTNMRIPVTQKTVRQAIRLRNKMIEELQDKNDLGQAAWFVVMAAIPQDRMVWRDILHPKKVFLFLTPLQECIRRIKEDPSRQLVIDQQINAAATWWKKYRLLPDEEIIDTEVNQ